MSKIGGRVASSCNVGAEGNKVYTDVIPSDSM